MTHDAHTGTSLQRPLAGVMLIAAGAVFLLGEFVPAAAWTDPPYSYTYHYISNLGVRGPVEALGQVMNSPLARVMNAGFFLFGIAAFLGVVALHGIRGPRRWLVMIPAAAMAIGGVLLALNPGDGQAGATSVDYHALGALGTIVGGNVLVIALGRFHPRIGVSPRAGRAMVVLGVIGLVSLPVFLADAGSGANLLIGLVERCAAYPPLAGLIVGGMSIRKRPA